MKLPLLLAIFTTILVAPVGAQFTGPSVQGRETTVAAAQDARLGQYVSVTGNVVSHLRGDYFMFSDTTGEMRVEIGGRVWQGREVGPDTLVRLMGEVDRGVGGRYIWVKSLDIVQ